MVISIDAATAMSIGAENLLFRRKTRTFFLTGRLFLGGVPSFLGKRSIIWGTGIVNPSKTSAMLHSLVADTDVYALCRALTRKMRDCGIGIYVHVREFTVKTKDPI